MQNFTIHSSFVRKPEFCRTMSRLRRRFIELGSCLRRNDGELNGALR